MTNQRIKARCFIIALLAMSACATEPAKNGGDFADATTSDFYNGPMLKSGKAIALADGGIVIHGGLEDHPRAFSAAFSTEGGQPIGAGQAHEAVASSLWSGRTFHKIGRKEDDRLTSYRKFDIANEIPKGWSFKGEGVFHEASGLQCDVRDEIQVNETDQDGNAKTSVQIFELDQITIFNENGLDVGCNYVSQGNAIVTRYASYYPDRTLQEHVDGSVAAIRQNFNIQSEEEVILPLLTLDNNESTSEALGDHHAGGFIIGEIDGVPYKTALWLTVTNDWHVKVRATYPKQNFASEFMGAITFVLSNWRINQHTDQSGPPTSATSAEV